MNEFYENNRHLFVQFVKTFLFRVRMRVCIFIKNWMERHFADFREDRYARKRLQVRVKKLYLIINIINYLLIGIYI